MGKGDKRSRKGKIWRSSYGNSRPKTKVWSAATAKSATAATTEAPTPVVEPTPTTPPAE